MSQEQNSLERNTLIANLFTLGGLTLLVIGSLLATILAYQTYQKSLTNPNIQEEVLPPI